MADVWTDKLSEYIDGELSGADVGGLERHLETCEECRATVDQLRAVASRAADLQDRAPDADLWAGISSRIKETASEETSVADISKRAKTGRHISFSVPQLLAAGIALMFVSAGSVWLALSGDGELVSPMVAETPLQGESAVLLASFDDPGYDAAVAELERILEAGRDRLDPATVSVLEQSLATIDQAIAEARAALQTDPTNHYLSEHLSATMNQKVRLLRQAARLASSAS
jgi:DNA-binding FrmR family transcriptional regulator